MTTALAVEDQLARLVDAFTERFGRRPTAAAVAPGRVNLIGEHTDYNDGFVMPMAIDRQTMLVADRAPEQLVTVATTLDQPQASFVADASLMPGQPAWANYVRGTIKGMIDHGIHPGGFDALVDSTVPLGGGLSSSAALEVATATLCEVLAGNSLEPVQKALVAQHAEHTFANVPCGIMDQFISTLGQADHAMLLDCRSKQPRMVRMDDPSIAVLIANTNVKHELSGGEYAQRRAQCEAAARALDVPALRDATHDALYHIKATLDPVAFKRAHHVIGENERTLRAAELIEAADWDGVGRLMFDSHFSLRDSFEVSCPELDIMVELAAELSKGGGVFGSRMTGGGFGGCTVSLIRADRAEAITRHLYTRYLDRTGIEPTIFVTRPSAGARSLAVPDA